MGCSSCGQRAQATTQYPYEALMPDGSKSMVSSAADERAQRSKIQAQMRETSRAKGYTAS